MCRCTFTTPATASTPTARIITTKPPPPSPASAHWSCLGRMGDRLRLFHVSEKPGITIFNPRTVPSPDTGVTGEVVWAVDEDHLPNYLLPRDCPRVTFRATPQTSGRDIAGWFDNTDARR